MFILLLTHVWCGVDEWMNKVGSRRGKRKVEWGVTVMVLLIFAGATNHMEKGGFILFATVLV